MYARVLRVGARGRRPACSASAPRAVGLARLLAVRAVSCPLGVRAVSFARRVVSKPAPRATRLPSAALRAARLPSAAPRADRSPSVELVFSCLFACWCPGAAARPLAVRAASFARRVVSKPGQALPPPPGTRAKPFGSFGVLHSGSSVFSLVANGVVLLNGCNAPSQVSGFSFCPRLGRIVRRGEPATERVHRPATASSLGATRRGLCLPSQLRFPLAFGR